MIQTKPHRALIAAGVLLGLTLTYQAHGDTHAEKDYEVAPVTQGAFEAQVTVQGRYAADKLGEIKFKAEQYTGELIVAEVLTTHGKVEAEQAVLKLEAPDLDEQLTDARHEWNKAKLRFEWARQESKIAEEERAVAAERRKLSLADTLSAHQRWDAFGKADAYQSAELEMQRREDRFADEAQELKQLEELYDGAKLASRTQDVVLGRARRSLAVSKKYLEIARRNHKVQIEETLPNQERDFDNSLRWMQTEHANAAWRDEVAAVQQEWALEASAEALEDAEEVVVDLVQDAASMRVIAEKAGVITAIGLKAGDKVQSGQTLATLYDAQKGTIKASLSSWDLRVVQEGSTAKVSWHWFDELSSEGTVSLIGWQGQAGGETEAKYDVTIKLDRVPAQVRPGMAASITITKKLGEDVLSVPWDAVVRNDDGLSYCMVQVEDGFERRVISIGAGNDDRVQIIKGLLVGDAVRVPAE